MEYAYYILGVLLAGFILLRLISYSSGRKISEPSRRQSSTRSSFFFGTPVMPTAGKRRARKVRTDPNTRKVVHRELQKVPIPWGWPGHTTSDADGSGLHLSDSMRSFTDRLIRQKELVNGRALDPRSSRSVRALLEDRYAPVNSASMRSIEYQAVKAPLLRDPSAPIDQMDSFGTRGLKPNPNRMQNQARMKANAAGMLRNGRIKSLDIKDIKLPWGW